MKSRKTLNSNHFRHLPPGGMWARRFKKRERHRSTLTATQRLHTTG